METESVSLQTKLAESKEEIKKRIEEEKPRCYFCKEVDYDLEWFCGGGLFSSNPTSHRECYKKALEKQFGFNGKGYVKDGEEWRIFSETTGWEKINPKNIRNFFIGIMGSEVFPYSIQVYEGETFKYCLGVTAELVEEIRNFVFDFGLNFGIERGDFDGDE